MRGIHKMLNEEALATTPLLVCNLKKKKKKKKTSHPGSASHDKSIKGLKL